MHNLVILAGNVGGTPETRTTQGGTRITHFSLATSRPKRDSNGKILRDDNNRRLEDTEWHRITCFNGRSEEHTSELQSLMRISYAVFCLKKKKNKQNIPNITINTE